VIEAQEGQDAGVEVVDVDGVLDCSEADFVGGSDDLAASDSAAG
jgi:hypothetical protein